MDSPFMNTAAAGLAEHGWRVGRFEFPYMAGRRNGARRGPDRPDVLRQTWLDAVAAGRASGHGTIAIGGKSLGGRIASLIADEAGVQALVCFGYPFHPPGKPEQLRTKHLAALRTPTLILQGERDPFGTREDVAGYTLSSAIRVEWLPDGDHSFKPRRASGRTEAQNVAAAVDGAASFLRPLLG